MSMRISGSAILVALLAACGPQPDQSPGSMDAKETISCAVGGSGAFSDSCEVERAPADGKLFLVVRHPDGAFRRFEVLRDGRGLAPADGVDHADIRIAKDSLEVAIGPDRYRFPATQADNAAKP